MTDNKKETEELDKNEKNEYKCETTDSDKFLGACFVIVGFVVLLFFSDFGVVGSVIAPLIAIGTVYLV